VSASGIAKVTAMPDGLLVEFSSGIVVFYLSEFLWQQKDYYRVSLRPSTAE
jgi:hypothetical protein